MPAAAQIIPNDAHACGKNAATSRSVGMEGCAPFFVQASDAAKLAYRAASRVFLPAASLAANAPQNVSPAAVVSTTSTFSHG